jgi:sporulation protein YlmC with PRC-barrel domain
MTPTRAARQPTRHRVALRILDHQVVGPDDELLGNVDDLELVISQDGWSVTALQVGPAALGQRLPGRLGRWTVAIWQRLRPDPDPRATRVPVADVREIGSAITVSETAARSLAASFGLELWLREFVVSRIPGAKGGGDERAEGDHADDVGVRKPRPAAAEPGPGSRTGSVSDVMGARVFAHDGSELGVVHELLCAEPDPGRDRDHLRVTHVQYGPHRAGSELGYDSDARQGPLVVGAVVRWWQRGQRVAPLEDIVDVDVEAGTLQVRSHTRHVHPHAL